MPVKSSVNVPQGIIRVFFHKVNTRTASGWYFGSCVMRCRCDNSQKGACNELLAREGHLYEQAIQKALGNQCN